MILAQKGYEVTGISLGEGALELDRKVVAAANIRAVIEKQDLVNLDYANGQFDPVSAPGSSTIGRVRSTGR